MTWHLREGQRRHRRGSLSTRARGVQHGKVKPTKRTDTKARRMWWRW